MMSLMAALTSSMLSTPLVLFFQKQTCRRYQSSSSRSSGAKNSTLRPQELLSSSFCRRESADRGKQWVTTSSRPSSFGKQSTHWLLEAKQIKHLSKPLCEWRHDIDNILALRNISMKSLQSKKYKSTFHPKSWFHPDACEWSSDGCCNHLRELVSYHKQGDWDISGLTDPYPESESLPLKNVFSSSGCGELKGCEPSKVRKYIMIDPTSSHSLSFLYFLTIYAI